MEKRWLKSKAAVLLTFIMAISLMAGCGNSTGAEDQPESASKTATEISSEKTEAQTEEDNESVDALMELVSKESLTIAMSMYGGFEQVGSIGQELPRNDKQTTTDAGDIMLYSGNQIVVFYGSNSWSYTRLGHIEDKSDEKLRELLGNCDVSITIKAE